MKRGMILAKKGSLCAGDVCETGGIEMRAGLQGGSIMHGRMDDDKVIICL